MGYNNSLSMQFFQDSYDASVTGSTYKAFWMTSGVVDNIPTTTNMIDVYWDFSAAKTWDTGNVNNVYGFYINPGGLFFDGASTVNDATVMAFAGPHLQRTNATISVANVVKFEAGYTTASGTTNQIELYPLQIEDGVGTVDSIYGINSPGNTTISLGNQTASLTNLALINLEATQYDSTTNVRTVTNAYTVRLGGPPSGIGNVTFTNAPETLRVETGISHFKGRTVLAKGADVASANDLTLGDDGNVFKITGTTTVNAITSTNWATGSQIILIFAGALTVKHNTAGGAGTAKIFLDGSTDLTTAANTVLGLVFDSTQWQQTSLKSA